MSPSPLEDETLYNKGKVRITRTLLEIKGTQYQIRNIDTIKQEKKEPNRTDAERCILVGILIAIASLIFQLSVGYLLLGFIVVLIGVYWFDSLKTVYTILIATTGGKEQSYSSENLDEIKAIKSALEKAMARLA